jgi:hypothetical protein
MVRSSTVTRTSASVVFLSRVDGVFEGREDFRVLFARLEAGCGAVAEVRGVMRGVAGMRPERRE